MANNRIYGFLRSFEKGINSDISPILLPPNQLAFATNATMRGDFATQRPNFFNLTLVDNTAGAFQTGLFQGACYYRGLDGSIMVAVNGKLFQVTISGTTATVNQITLPDSLQSTTAPQNWMWQAERFLIWNDGVNLPIFYDGVFGYSASAPANPRRSIGGDLTALGTNIGAFTIPAVGQQVLDGNGNPVGVPLNTTIDSTAWSPYYKQSFLVGVSQFTLAGTYVGTQLPFQSCTCNVLKSTSTTDTLLSSLSSSTTINNSSQYAGWIVPSALASSGVVQYKNDSVNPTAITSWSQLIAPVAGTSPVAINLSIATNQILCPPNTGISLPYPIYSGGNISVNGTISCSVSSYSNNGGNPSFLTALNGVTPPQSATGVTASTILFPASNGQQAKSVAITNPQVMNGGSNAVNNYFIIQLNQAPLGLSNGSRYTFTISDASNVTFTFTGVVSGSTLIQCQISATTTAGAVQTIAAGAFPTLLNQVVQCSTSNVTAIGSVYNYNTSTQTYSPVSVLASGSSGQLIPVKLGTSQSITAGMIIYGQNQNLDVFVVTSVTSSGGTGQIYAQLINQTGTEGNVITDGTSIIPLPEIPISTMGVYGMGRNWISLVNGTNFVGGDIVGGSSGTNTAPTNYNYSDAVLKVSENALLAGGTTFAIPGAGEKIRAMQFVAALDASLGQGALQVFTDDTVFSCNAPTDQSTWSSMTSPILTESLIGNGGISQCAVSQSNSDLIFRTSDGQVQSMLLARLDYNQWGNTPISKEISRIIKNDNINLLPFNTSTVFNNRLLLGCQPVQQTRGVVHQAIAALNFDAISSLAGKSPSIWEGQWKGLNVLQFVTGFFNSVKRCFALCLNQTSGNIEIHEILNDNAATMDDGATAVTWSFESPMIFSNEKRHEYKRLCDGEIYLDSITSDVQVTAYYKADEGAWTYWYGTMVKYQANDSGFRPRVGLGSPNPQVFDKTNNRPMREGFDFQVQIVLTGDCRFLGGRFGADLIAQPEFAKPI